MILNKTIIIITLLLTSLYMIYDKTAKEKYFFQASNLQSNIGKIVDSKRYIKDHSKKGFLAYGPYIKLNSGKYTVEISYYAKDAIGARYDIVTDSSTTILSKGLLSQTDTKLSKIISITSSNPLEVRIYYDGKGELTLNYIEITKFTTILELLGVFIIILIVITILYNSYKYSKGITFFTIFLLVIIILSFMLQAYKNYYDYKELTYKKMPLTKNIAKFYLDESLKSEYIKLTAPSLKKDKKLESFYLMVDEKKFEKLNSNLPLSGMQEYVSAKLKINNEKVKKVKIRYRGGSSWNWRYTRKSIKIKLKSKKMYNMMNKINLTVLYSQDMFIEPITQEIAKKVGALAPEVKTVRMYLNGHYIGLYLYLDQIDESFLRKNKLMPGSIYDGDYGLEKDYSSYMGKDGIAKLWFDSKMWEKKASRNAEQKTNREDIQLLIDAVNNYTHKEFYNFADTYISSQYYTFLALDIFWGTHHHDYFHNHKIYFDPYKGQYTAISWDIRFWRQDKNKDNSYYPLVEKIALNPLLEYKRDKELYRILNTINIDDINQLMKKEKDRIMPSYLADKKRKKISIDTKLFPWKETFNPPQLTVATKQSLDNIFKTYSKNIENRISILNKMLDDVSVKYAVKTLKQTTKITLSVDGNSPVKLNYKSHILYPARNIVDKNALSLIVTQYGKTHLENTAQFYTFYIKNKEFNEKLFQDGINAITGKKVIFKKVSHILVKETDSTHPWKLKQSKQQIKFLSGTINVTKTLVFDKATEVVIKPNTTFIISPNQSIYFYSKVTALGTKEQPIKFIAKNPSKPWGLVALQGEKTSNSKFEYCYFKDGSVDTKNLIHYTAQFNIHNTKNFEVKNCFIGKNYKGDDSMHIAYASGIVDSTTFDGARSDGLDIDISNVVIINSTFKNAGNDGLDIMTTKMQASNNIFTNTGDKGISIGEWSEANITNSTFTNTLIGLEIKDKSKVTAENLTFIGSKEKAINLYNKNKRYNKGGFLKGKNIKFITNSKVTADKKSEVHIYE